MTRPAVGLSKCWLAAIPALVALSACLPEFDEAAYVEDTEERCSDGIDNDEDGLTDCDDPACEGRFDCTAPFDAAPIDARPSRSVQAIAMGHDHTCALLEDGAVRCWGEAQVYGRLGYGSTHDVGDNETPSSAGDVDIGGVVTQLAAGRDHTCALLEGGAVRCWGRGGTGQLGYADTDNIGDDETPASAGDVAVGGTVTEIAAGGFHTCALLEDGAVRCWGQNTNGATGHPDWETIGDDETPASAGDIDLGEKAIQITAGGWHSCALLESRSVRCWGANWNGQLGYGYISLHSGTQPPSANGNLDIGSTPKQVVAGRDHTCALLENNRVRCWGRGTEGELGYASTETVGDDETPAVAGDVDVGALVEQISLWGAHTCALLQNGSVRCWGEGGVGQLGYGNTSTIGDNERPASAGNVELPGTAAQIAVGASIRASCSTAGKSAPGAETSTGSWAISTRATSATTRPPPPRAAS